MMTEREFYLWLVSQIPRKSRSIRVTIGIPSKNDCSIHQTSVNIVSPLLFFFFFCH